MSRRGRRGDTSAGSAPAAPLAEAAVRRRRHRPGAASPSTTTVETKGSRGRSHPLAGPCGRGQRGVRGRLVAAAASSVVLVVPLPIMRMFSAFRWRRRVRLGLNGRHLSLRERHWSSAIDRRRRRLVELRRRKGRGANRRLEGRRCCRGLDGRHCPGAGGDGPVAGVVVDREDETNQAEGQRAQKHGSKPHVLGTLHPGIRSSLACRSTR
jgi:hypothetical protein